MISVHFQDKTFNITVIQVYAPTSNAEENEQGIHIIFTFMLFYSGIKNGNSAIYNNVDGP